jgi:hypothetical protein
MTKSILIAGGYGLVGGHIARHLRHLMPDARLVIAGRNPDKAGDLLAELGNAEGLRLDTMSPPDALTSAGPIDAVVSALQDPHDHLLTHAIRNGVAHLSITRSVTDMAPLVAHVGSATLRAPVIPTAHWQAGITTLAALDLAQSAFAKVDRIAIAALFDMADPIGPMTLEDTGSFFGKALLVEGGLWTWVDPDDHAAQLDIGGETIEARPMSVLDTPSLRAATGAAHISFHLGIGTSRGTKAGNAASHDIRITIEGSDAAGDSVARTRLVSDPRGQAQLTATGAALAAQRAIGGDGAPAPAAALLMPETILNTEHVMAALRAQGVTVEDR